MGGPTTWYLAERQFLVAVVEDLAHEPDPAEQFTQLRRGDRLVVVVGADRRSGAYDVTEWRVVVADGSWIKWVEGNQFAKRWPDCRFRLEHIFEVVRTAVAAAMDPDTAHRVKPEVWQIP